MIKIDFNKSSYDTLPPALRTLINFHWVQVLVKPLKDNYDIFTGYTFENNFELKHNSQVLSFNDYLNYHVPSSFRDCYIGEFSVLGMNYFWFVSEGKESTYLWLDSESKTDLYFIFGSEYIADNYDFTVYYDGDQLALDSEYLNSLRIWIDKMRIIGTTYVFKEMI